MTLNARVTELAAIILAFEGIARTVGAAERACNDPLRQKVAIVTGAGKGLGRAYAIYLAARGARVMVNNRRRSPSEPSRAQTRSYRPSGWKPAARHRELRQRRRSASGERIVQQALDTWGRLDVLVNNAGVDQRSTFHKVSVEQFRQIFDINFYGSLYVTHAAYARMRAAGYGRIVVSTSVAGLYGLHGLTAYAASKAALIGFMRTLAMEGKSHNVLTKRDRAVRRHADDRAETVPEEFMTTMRPGSSRPRSL